MVDRAENIISIPADQVNLALYLRRYIKIASKRWGMIALCTVIGLAIGIFVALKLPNKYQAYSTIGVVPSIEVGSAKIQEESSNYYENQLEYMTNASVQARIEKRLASYYSSSNEIPKYVIRAIKPPKKSFYKLVVESGDFDFCKLYAQIWPEEFLRYKQELREKSIETTFSSLKKDIMFYTMRLDQIRSNMIAFQKTHNVASAREMGNAAQQRLDKALDELEQKKAELMMLKAMTKEDLASGVYGRGNKSTGLDPQLKQDLKNLDAIALSGDLLLKYGDPVYLSLQMDLQSKKAEWQKYSETLKPKHPYMVNLQREIDQLEQRVNVRLDLIEQQRKAQIEAREKEVKGYEPVIEALKKEVMENRSIQVEYDNLKDQEVRTLAVLNDLQQNLEKINLVQRTEEKIDILESGMGTPAPVGPNRPLIILAGLFLGLASGIGLVYFLHQLDDRLDLAEDIEMALDFPVLGQIPIVSLKDKNKKQILITNGIESGSVFAESIRGVRSSLLFGCNREKKNILLVTSAIPGDGKTTFAVNFAITLMMAKHKVLIIDSDMRRGGIHNFLDVYKSPGLSDYLLGKADIRDIIRVGTGNLDKLNFITCGPVTNNPGELLVGERFKQLVAYVRSEFEYVIIDSPPLASIDDTFSIAGYSDGVLFVVKAGHTGMRFAKSALNSIQRRGAHVLGLVLNGITEDNPYYYYSHYYNVYYRATMPKGNGDFEKVDASKPVLSIQEEAELLASKKGIPTLEPKPIHKAEWFKSWRAMKKKIRNFKAGVKPDLDDDDSIT